MGQHVVDCLSCIELETCCCFLKYKILECCQQAHLTFNIKLSSLWFNTGLSILLMLPCYFPGLPCTQVG